MSVNKRKREKVCMRTNDGERLVRKPEKYIRHLVLNARDLPRHLAFDLALETGSSVGNAISLALLRHFLAFTSIRRAGQRTSVLWQHSICLPLPPTALPWQLKPQHGAAGTPVPTETKKRQACHQNCEDMDQRGNRDTERLFRDYWLGRFSFRQLCWQCSWSDLLLHQLLCGYDHQHQADQVFREWQTLGL